MSTFGPNLNVFQQIANGDMDALRTFIDTRNQEIRNSWSEQLSGQVAEAPKPVDELPPQEVSV